MAGRTWRDLQPQSNSINVNKKKGTNQKNQAMPSELNSTNQSHDIDELKKNALTQSPGLSRLINERNALESKMNHLSSGGSFGDQLNPRDKARFYVPSFAERQAEQRQWEQERLAGRNRILASRIHENASEPQPLRNLDQTPTQSQVSQWMRNRDQQRNNRREASRDRLSSLRELGNSANRARSALDNMSNNLDQLDRMSTDQGFDQDNNSSRSDRSQSQSELRSALDKPMRNIEKIEQTWDEKRDQISGAMDKIGPYVNQIEKRLSIDEGGSGNIFERMQRNRDRALTKRKQQLQQEKKDNNRRERASKKCRERKNSE